MRAAIALLAIVVGVTSCAQSCNSASALGVGASGTMVQGDMQHGDARGAMTLPDTGAAPAVVGIDWPFTPTLLWEAGKETTFSDGDPVETPSQFGSQTTVLPTQGTLASRLTYQDPCDVGPAIPCYYADGGDWWQEAAANAALTYLHDGTGATCFVVVETISTSGITQVFTTKTNSTSTLGLRVIWSSSTTDRLSMNVGNGSASVFLRPLGGTGLEDATWAMMGRHGTGETFEAEAAWRGATISSAGGAYVNTPSADPPGAALSIASAAGGASAAAIYIFGIACVDDYLADAVITDTWDAIEAETGALPQ